MRFFFGSFVFYFIARHIKIFVCFTTVSIFGVSLNRTSSHFLNSKDGSKEEAVSLPILISVFSSLSAFMVLWKEAPLISYLPANWEESNLILILSIPVFEACNNWIFGGILGLCQICLLTGKNPNKNENRNCYLAEARRNSYSLKNITKVHDAIIL